MAAGHQARSRESREKYQGLSLPPPPAFPQQLHPRAEPAEMGAWETQPTRHPFPQIEAGLRRAGVWVGDPGPAQPPYPEGSKVPLLFLAPAPTYTTHQAPSRLLPGEGRTGPASLTVCSLLCFLLPVIHRSPGGPLPSPSHSKHFSSELRIKP